VLRLDGFETFGSVTGIEDVFVCLCLGPFFGESLFPQVFADKELQKILPVSKSWTELDDIVFEGLWMGLEEPLRGGVKLFATTFPVSHVTEEEDEFECFEGIDVPCGFEMASDEMSLGLVFDSVEEIDEWLQ
jgi:hypothetical protein